MNIEEYRKNPRQWKSESFNFRGNEENKAFIQSLVDKKDASKFATEGEALDFIVQAFKLSSAQANTQANPLAAVVAELQKANSILLNNVEELHTKLATATQNESSLRKKLNSIKVHSVFASALGESSITTIDKWLVKEGDYVKKGTSICEISTDKVTTQQFAPESGILVKIYHKECETVDSKTTIAEIVEYPELIGFSNKTYTCLETNEMFQQLKKQVATGLPKIFAELYPDVAAEEMIPVTDDEVLSITCEYSLRDPSKEFPFQERTEPIVVRFLETKKQANEEGKEATGTTEANGTGDNTGTGEQTT